MAVKIEIDKNRRLSKKLRAASRRSSNTRPMFDAIGSLILGSIQAAFNQEGVPKWRRRVDNKPHKILDKTGRLRESIRVNVSSRGVEIGTHVAYGSHHQFGAPKANIPKREFLKITRADERTMVNIIEDYLTDPLR